MTKCFVFIKYSFFISCIVFGNYEIKLFKAESFIWFSLIFYERWMHQIKKSIIIHILSDCPWNLFQFLETNEAFIFCVIKGEDSFKAIFCTILTYTRTYTVNEFIKIDWFIFLSYCPNNVFDKRTSSVKIEFFKYFVYLYWIDFTASILIEN